MIKRACASRSARQGLVGKLGIKQLQCAALAMPFPQFGKAAKTILRPFRQQPVGHFLRGCQIGLADKETLKPAGGARRHTELLLRIGSRRRQH